MADTFVRIAFQDDTWASDNEPGDQFIHPTVAAELADGVPIRTRKPLHGLFSSPRSTQSPLSSSSSRTPSSR